MTKQTARATGSKVKIYNGWANRSTWNVSLWINNDEPLYRSATEFMKTYKGKRAYADFIRYEGLQDDKTPDNIQYLSSRLDYKELNAMMLELV